MPRQREFHPDDLLDGALRLFWEKGYEATSMRDIVERTGVNQFGIYSLYGGKQELFLAVLDRYRDTIVGSVFGIVERPGASLEAIHEYFETLIRAHSIMFPAMGCLMATTMAESFAGDEGIRERVQGHFERLRTGFIRALETARRAGEVPDDLAIPRVAEYLAVSVQGLAVYSRLNPDETALRTYVNTVLSILSLSASPASGSRDELVQQSREVLESRQKGGATGDDTGKP
jgi:TetR/AcrR family transcriptional regulator, transcriptional repressor for nem operon